MKRHLLFLCATANLNSSVVAQIYVEKVFSVDQAIPDYGQYVDVRSVSGLGMTSISAVSVGLNLHGAAGNTMRLGDYFVSLTHGTGSEEERVAVLMNRPGATDTRPWGSSLSSADFRFDDTVGASNVFGAASITGTYAADGRLSVNPYSSPPAYNAQDSTHGLASLNGDLLASDTWSLLVADTRQGGAGTLSSWKLSITGLAPQTGTLDPGAGGSVGDAGGSGSQEILAQLQVSGNAADSVTANVSGNLVLSGGLSGAGNLVKTGNGELTLGGNSSGFTGTVDLTEGALTIASSQALGSGATIQVSSSGSTLNLANASRLDAPITLSGLETVLILNGAGILGGAMTGEGSLRKEGSGLTSLTGAINLGGGVAVEAGVMSLDGSISGNGALTVATGGTLMGSGTANVTTTISGMHSPGNSPGIQIFTEDLTYTTGSRIIWELNSNTLDGRGTNYDGIDVSGNLTFDVGSTIELSFITDFANTDWYNNFWNHDISGTAGWKIFDVEGTVTGAENLLIDTSAGWTDSNGVLLGTIRAGAGFSTYLGTDGIYLNYQAAPIPETRTAMLLGISCAFFLLKRSHQTGDALKFLTNRP